MANRTSHNTNKIMKTKNKIILWLTAIAAYAPWTYILVKDQSSPVFAILILALVHFITGIVAAFLWRKYREKSEMVEMTIFGYIGFALFGILALAVVLIGREDSKPATR